MDEIWKDVPGHDNYQISTHGRVLRNDGRMLTGTTTSNGYIRIGLNGKYYRLHRLVLLTFVGECPEDMQVNHIDGNKVNNHLENLEYVTASENMYHAYQMGLKTQVTTQGENHHGAKINSEQVKEIRRARGKIKQTELAKMYGLSKHTISKIQRRIKWKHVE